MARAKNTFNLTFAYNTIDACQDKYLKRLKEFINIKSISDDIDYRLEVERAILWYSKKLKELNMDVKLVRPYYKEKFYLGKEVPLTKVEPVEFPDVILASMNNDLSKPTVLIYGHVDVRPVEDPEKWSGDPWTLNLDNEKLVGRGVADDKGPLVVWLSAIEVLKNCAASSLNVRMIIEGMAERNSEFLQDILIELRPTFLKNVDHVVLSDNNWLNLKRPCITFGMRGLMYFHVEIQSGTKLVHSGVAGGVIEEVMVDAGKLINAMLRDNNSVVFIPGFYDQVKMKRDQLTIEEWKSIDFQNKDLTEQEKIFKLTSWQGTETLKKLWTLPEISFHGIENTFDSPTSPRLIPPKILLKFSLRTVPNMNVYRTKNMVQEFIANFFKKLRTRNTFQIRFFEGPVPFLADKNSVNYQCAYRALQTVWKVNPDFVQSAGSHYAATILERHVERDVLLLPITPSNDNRHWHEENITKTNFVQGIKTAITYFYELAMTPREFRITMQERQQKRREWRESIYLPDGSKFKY